MTCECSEFVTNAYEYLASVANFEKISNIVIRKAHSLEYLPMCERSIKTTLCEQV